ncbi:hypothetical protein [Gordonia terrae]
MIIIGLVLVDFSNTAPAEPDTPQAKQRREMCNGVGYTILFVGWIGVGLSWALAASSFWVGVWKFVVAFIVAVIVSLAMSSAS